MTYTFEPQARAYWLRVGAIVGAFWIAATLGILIPGFDDNGGFTLMGFLIGGISLTVMVLLKPRCITLHIDTSEVRIEDGQGRVLYSKPTKQVGSISPDRYGHILGMHTAHLFIAEHGSKRPSRFGPIMVSGLPNGIFDKIDDALFHAR